MRTLLTVLTTCCFALPPTAALADEPVKKEAVREIAVKDMFPQARGGPCQPIVITNARDLKKELNLCPKGGGRKNLELLLQGIDFEKEQVVYFAWTGPEQDRLTFQVECCPKQDDVVTNVAFQYLRSLNNNRAGHFYLYVLPKRVKWNVVEK